MSDISELVYSGKAPPLRTGAARQAEKRWNTRTKPPGSLGTLEDIAVQLTAITGSCPPEVGKKAVVVAAADHGVASEGTSAYPQEVTRQMVANFARGGAAINVLARRRNAEIHVVDAGLLGGVDEPSVLDRRAGRGTKNMIHGPAMSGEQVQFCLRSGAQLAKALVQGGTDIVALGEMGIGNTTAASAVSAALLELCPVEVTGPGTGLDEEGVCRKAQVVGQALHKNRPDPDDPVGVLQKVGGFELAFLAGFMLSGARHRLPMIVDGFICASAALCAGELMSGLTNYLFAGHLSGEPGHEIILQRLGLQPLLDMQMRLGEGSGAAAALGIMVDSVALLNEMATFSAAGVSTERGGNRR